MAALFDSDFAQQLILLGLTVVLTGLAVPVVLKNVEYRKTREQQAREAALARQAKVIEAQATFLDAISEALWKWRYLSMRLAYYGSMASAEEFAETEAEYAAEIWPLLNVVRNEISRSRRLASERVYQRLLELYERDMVELGTDCDRARAIEADLERRVAFVGLNRRVFDDVTQRIDDVLHEIAVELQLTNPAAAATRYPVNGTD